MKPCFEAGNWVACVLTFQTWPFLLPCFWGREWKYRGVKGKTNSNFHLFFMVTSLWLLWRFLIFMLFVYDSVTLSALSTPSRQISTWNKAAVKAVLNGFLYVHFYSLYSTLSEARPYFFLPHDLSLFPFGRLQFSTPFSCCVPMLSDANRIVCLTITTSFCIVVCGISSHPCLCTNSEDLYSIGAKHLVDSQIGSNHRQILA